MGIVIRDTSGSDSQLISSTSADPVRISNIKTVELIKRARFLGYVRRDYDRAEEVYRQVINTNPSDTQILCNYADFLGCVRREDRKSTRLNSSHW